MTAVPAFDPDTAGAPYDETWMDTSETAAWLKRTTERNVGRMIRNGVIPALFIGGRWLVPQRATARYLTDRAIAAAKARAAKCGASAEESGVGEPEVDDPPTDEPGPAPAAEQRRWARP